MKQLWTLYPHTPDNSFLGFAMQLPDHTVPRSKRKNQAVLYGKKGCNYIHINICSVQFRNLRNLEIALLILGIYKLHTPTTHS